MNNISYSDFKNICRMCMLSCDIKFPQDKVISDVFYKLTDIHFETNDELPKHICLKCFDKINEIYEFSFKCKRTHANLLKCVNDFKNAQINKGQETLEVISEPFKTEKEISIKDEIEYVKDEVLNPTSDEYVNDELKLKEDIEEDKNIEFEKIMIPGTSGDQNINCFEDDLLNRNTLNIKVENEEESNDSVNPNNFNEDTYLLDISDSSYIDSEMHGVERPFKCQQCSKSYTRSCHLKTHMRTHSGECPYKCEHCPKSFARSYSLETHMRTHTGKRSYKCEQCSKFFSQLSNLNSHMRTHSGERPYKCELCLKTFARSHTLKNHMRMHNDERPYKCELCSKSYTQYAHLEMHMRVHSGERPYECELCSKTFSRPFILKSHMSTHSGECPFKCELCSKAFSRAYSLKIHMHTHSA